MGHLRLDQEARVRDAGGQELGVLALDCLIPIAVDDPGRCLDARQFGRRPFRRVSHICLICSTKGLYSPGVGDRRLYPSPSRAMKALKMSLLKMSATADGSELAAKANSFETRAGCFMAMSRPMMAPSIQPTIAALPMLR